MVNVWAEVQRVETGIDALVYINRCSRWFFRRPLRFKTTRQHLCLQYVRQTFEQLLISCGHRWDGGSKTKAISALNESVVHVQVHGRSGFHHLFGFEVCDSPIQPVGHVDSPHPHLNPQRSFNPFLFRRPCFVSQSVVSCIVVGSKLVVQASGSPHLVLSPSHHHGMNGSHVFTGACKYPNTS